MAEDDTTAEISVSDAQRLARMFREWTAFKKATGGDSGGQAQGVGVELNAPLAWVRITDKTSIPNGRYRYTVEVIPNPFGPKLSPVLATLATSQVGYCVTEFGDTPPGFDATEALKGASVLAQLFWTWFESNDPTNGKWAWWFTPGGGGTLPSGQYPWQVFQMGSQNQPAWDFPRAHGLL